VRKHRLALALGAAVFGVWGASSFAVGAPAPATSEVARFAQTQLDAEFFSERGVLYTACPYALGTYSFIELAGLRRTDRSMPVTDDEKAAGVTERRELTIQPKRARYYWAAGTKWIDWSRAPALRYEAELRSGGWIFRAEQHICARGEPQVKPLAANVPKP
jgi:hypothetical protein